MGKIALYGTLSSAVGEPIVDASEVGGLDMALKPTRITYQELKKLIDTKELVPGHNYIITDYAVESNEAKGILGFVGASFDIMVTALTNGSFDENAKALPHEDDTYYTNNNLAAWEIKYCFDNDSSRFQWARESYDAVMNGNYYTYAPEHDITFDGMFYYAFAKGSDIVYALKRHPAENDPAYYLEEDYFYGNSMVTYRNFQKNDTGGRGVIYYMKDEFGNEAPYDFKGVKFVKTKADAAGETLEDAFTFTYSPDGTDHSLTGKCYNNVIKPYVVDGQQKLNNVVFQLINLYPSCARNIFENNCHDIRIVGNSFDNNFSIGAHDVYMAGSNTKNSFGFESGNIALGMGCERNTFSPRCDNISTGLNCNDNVFSNRCFSLALGNNSSMNTFGMNCNSITLGKNCMMNRFGDNVSDVKFIYFSEDNTEFFTADYCVSNYFESNTSGLAFAYTYEKRPVAESSLRNVHVVSAHYKACSIEVVTGCVDDIIKVSPNNNAITTSTAAWVDYGTSAPVPRRTDSGDEDKMLVNIVRNGKDITLWRNIDNIIPEIPEIPDIPTEVMSVLKNLNLSHLEFFNGFVSNVEILKESKGGLNGFEGVYFDQVAGVFVAKYGDLYYNNWINYESVREDFEDGNLLVLDTKIFYNVSDGKRYVAGTDPSGKYERLPSLL